MNTIITRSGGLEKLVDRHIELCRRSDWARGQGRRKAARLLTMTDGKTVADCLSDLVDRTLAAYDSSGFVQDFTIFALKLALLQAISGELDEILLGP